MTDGRRLALVVGAPKCGTGSLFAWLAAHPEVDASVPKETHFFTDPDSPFAGRHNVHRDGLLGHDRYFRNPGRPVRLDGSTHHLFQRRAPGLIARESPLTTVIVALRDPALRILSAYRFAVFDRGTLDPRLSFSEYADRLIAGELDAVRRRFRLERAFLALRSELDHSRYVHHLDRWRAEVGSERMALVRLEEIRSAPREAVASLCRRLEIDETPCQALDFRAANVTRRPSWPRAHRLVRWLAVRVPVGGSLRRRFSHAYRSTFRSAPAPSTLDLEAVERLRAVLLGDTRRLAERYAVDVADWVTTDG